MNLTQTNPAETEAFDMPSQELKSMFCFTPPNSYPDVMTEPEVVEYLRIPALSDAKAANYKFVIDNLIRMRGLPCLHLCRKRAFCLSEVRQWVLGQSAKEAA